MLEAYSQGGIAMSQHDMMSCWLKRVACSVRGGVAYVCSASSRICPATDTSQSLDMYDAAATQLLQHLPLFSQLFVSVTAMQALDAAFLAPAAPVATKRCDFAELEEVLHPPSGEQAGWQCSPVELQLPPAPV